MPSFYDHGEYHHSRPRCVDGASHEYLFYHTRVIFDIRRLLISRRFDLNEKVPRPHDFYHEYDIRHQYPRTLSRPQPFYQPSYQPKRPWPPFPKAEDENIALSREYRPAKSDTSSEEAQSRGTIDQQPIILDVLLPTPRGCTGSPEELSDSDSDSSSGSFGPHTPIDSDKVNQDRRYVYIPQEGIEIPLTYDQAREPKYATDSTAHQDPEQARGRAQMPRLETGFGSNSSPKADVPLRERAPSPYAFVPRAKPKETRTTGEHLLSPELINAKAGFSQRLQREPSRGPPPLNTRVHKEHEHIQSAPLLPRPPMTRFATTAYPGEPVAPASAVAGYNTYRLPSSGPDSSGPDSSHGKSFWDRDTYPSGQNSPESPRKVPSRADRDRTPRPEKGLRSELRPPSPPPRARSSGGEKAIPSQQRDYESGLQAANIMLPNAENTPNSRRRASPRTSPVGSPVSSSARSSHASPAGTPPAGLDQRGDPIAHTRQTLSSQVPPSPSMPLPSPKTPQTPSFIFSGSEHERPSRQFAPRSRRTSPLPSPAPTACSGPQIDIRAPPPASQQKSLSYGTEETEGALYGGSRHPSLAPLAAQQSALKPPTLGQRRRASSSADTRPKSINNLAPLEMDKSPRSPSHSRRPTVSGRAVSVGVLPRALPSCPRSSPVAGYDDWYTLAGRPRAFSVCPTCRDAIFDAGLERHFRPKLKKTAEHDKVRCDFSVPWVRMAWNLTIGERRGDPEPLYAMADILADETPCPGAVEDVRDWYRLADPETGKSVHDFQVCPQCVRSLETIHPILRGVFHRSHSHHHRQERTCSMRTDSKRFTTYLDLLRDAAKQAEEYRRPPNMSRFIGLTHRIAGIPECARDDMLLGQEWYTIPDLPELTVCEDCYDEVVWPAIKRDFPIAAAFKRDPEAVAPSHVGVSCQLYSPRMRKIFQEACHRDDLQMLKSAAVQRYRVEMDLQARNLEVRKWPKEERMREVARLVEEWKHWE